MLSEEILDRGMEDVSTAGASKNAADRLRRLIAGIDQQIAAQLDVILHAPRFQALEGLWRATSWLCETAGEDKGLKLLVLDCRWSDLRNDIERSGTIENSELYRKIHDEGFGIAGGEPLGLMVIPHEVRFGTAGSDDLAIVRSLAQIGASAFCPMIFGHAPSALGMADFADNDFRRDVRQSLDGSEFARWRSFRQTADSRYICLAGPRLLLRAPADRAADRDIGSVYQEAGDATGDYLWASAAFGVGHIVLRAQRDFRWAANILGTPAETIGGGVLTDLPECAYPVDAATAMQRLPIDASLTETRENDYVQLGLAMLRPAYFTPYAAFFNLPSVHEAARRAEGQPNLDSSLHYTLCVSRFAHFIKVMVRDWVGSHLTARDCEARLQHWISRYCNADANASATARARFPLRHAQIRVEDNLVRPGSFHCEIWLRPHFQADQIISELKLQTTLLDAA